MQIMDKKAEIVSQSERDAKKAPLFWFFLALFDLLAIIFDFIIFGLLYLSVLTNFLSTLSIWKRPTFLSKSF